MTELWNHTATDIVRLVKSKEVSVREVTESALAHLDSVNTHTNAVAIGCHSRALARADELDKANARQVSAGSMLGVPVTVKVNIDQAGFANTNGLRLQEKKIATENHPVVDNLEKSGAIIIGRTNTPAFSMRWFTRNSLHGATLNPVNRQLTPGGSSGGAASAVASGIGSIAHGTDIAGSIRYPAFACGVHGLRPSLGRVPAWNPGMPDRYIGGQMMAVSGPLARNMDDLELGFHAMAQGDVRDPWWVPAPLHQPMPAKRVALCLSIEGWQVDPAVENNVRNAARIMGDAGWEVSEVSCPPIREAAQLNMVLWVAEMMKVGRSVIDEEGDPDAIAVFDHLARHAGPVDANGLLDAMKARVGLTRQWLQFLEEYPVMLCPVSSEAPFEDHLDVKSDADFDRVFEAQLLQIGFPCLGLPGLSVSTGVENQIPTGVQLMASRFREDVLIQAGRDLEAAVGVPQVVSPTA